MSLDKIGFQMAGRVTNGAVHSAFKTLAIPCCANLQQNGVEGQRLVFSGIRCLVWEEYAKLHTDR